MGKTAKTFLLLLVLLTASGVIAWHMTRPEIPVTRAIEDLDGRTLEAVIVGKEGRILHLDRVSDGVRYEVRADQLGWRDRFFAWRLPETTPPPVPVIEEQEPEDPYIVSRERRIAELEERCSVYAAEISSGSLSDILTRRRSEEFASAKREIAELRAAIAAQRAKKRSSPPR